MIKYRAFYVATTIVIVLLIVQTTPAQRGPRRNPQRPPTARAPAKKTATPSDDKMRELYDFFEEAVKSATKSEREKKTVTLPSDDKMRGLYMDFFKEAVRLATKYERENKPEKARQVYADMTKLFPDYKKAREKLAELEEKEATADRKTITISANERWQDTGIRVIAGKPLRISCVGTWTVNFSHNIDANGVELAAGQRSFKLGSLIGAIFESKDKKPTPFAIGSQTELRPSQSGRLILQMHDVDHADNRGRIRVTIQGTFDRL